MEVSNKELIDKLQAYFLEQDPKDIARGLANMMIDIHRIVTYENLSEDQKNSLKFRMAANTEELKEFIKGNKRKKFTLVNIFNE